MENKEAGIGMSAEARGVAEKCGGHWKEHDLFPKSDWHTDVVEDNTRLGYWDWVVERIEITSLEAEDLKSLPQFIKGQVIIPKGSTYPEGALTVLEWDYNGPNGVALRAYPEGGGMGLRFTLKSLKEYDFQVVDWDKVTVKWKKANFSIDDWITVEGYHCDERWNGWACPLFPIESVKKIVEWLSKDASEADAGVKIGRNGAVYMQPEEGAPFERVPGVTKKRNGIPDLKLYNIGSGCWTWESDD